MKAPGTSGTPSLNGQLKPWQLRNEASPSAIGMIWATWLIVVLVLALVNPLVKDSSSLAGTVAVLVHMMASIAILVVVYPQNSAAILAISLVARTSIVLWDIYFSHLMPVPNSGADTESYFWWAVQIGDDLSLLSQETTGGGLFSSMFGVLFHVIGPARVFAQYTNALFGLTIVLLVLTMLREFRVQEPIATRMLLIAAFLPNALMLSAVFLRESVIAVLIAASLLFFVRWFVRGGPWRVIVAVLFVLLASVFHAGVITVALGYMFVTLFYKRNIGRFSFGAQSIPYLALFGAIVAVTLVQYPDLFLGKFQAYESESELLWVSNYRAGGSAYLESLTITSYDDIIRFGPLRAFYFLGSPMPWDFRSFSDLMSFALDSMFYLGTLALAILNYRHLGQRKPLVIALLVLVSLASLVFGAGVSNAGTAMRHRYKLVAIFLVLAAAAARKPDTADAHGVYSAQGSIETVRLSEPCDEARTGERRAP